MFEMKVSPLRQLYTKYLHSKIPPEAWTKELETLFSSLKTDLTTEPVLARYDSSKPIFLKTDWSALGMSFILTQPGNDKASVKATRKLLDAGICDFDLHPSAPRLRAISSGMRKCTEGESHYHSFVGEIAALRWAIAKNKLYLWGVTFYVLCDMKTTYRILEYDGPIHSLRRWCQELQNYHFVIFHRPATMMADVDILNRGPYHRVSTMYYAMTAAIRTYDTHYNEKAYDTTVYKEILAKGKLNLKKISSWTITELYSLRAATLLTTISESIGDTSTVLSKIADSRLSHFANEDTPITSSHTVTYPVSHRHVQFAIQSKKIATPKADLLCDESVMTLNNVNISSDVMGSQGIRLPSISTHHAKPALNNSQILAAQPNLYAMHKVVASGNVFASFLTSDDTIDVSSQRLEHYQALIPMALDTANINASNTDSIRNTEINTDSIRNNATSNTNSIRNTAKPNTDSIRNTAIIIDSIRNTHTFLNFLGADARIDAQNHSSHTVPHGN